MESTLHARTLFVTVNVASVDNFWRFAASHPNQSVSRKVSVFLLLLVLFRRVIPSERPSRLKEWLGRSIWKEPKDDLNWKRVEPSGMYGNGVGGREQSVLGAAREKIDQGVRCVRYVSCVSARWQGDRITIRIL